MTFHNFTERLRGRFDLIPDKDDEQKIISQINSSVSFTGATDETLRRHTRHYVKKK